MYKLNLIVSIVILSIIASCNETPKEKAVAAATDVATATNDLAIAKEDFKVELENYRVSMMDRLLSNDTLLENYKLKAAKEKTATKKEYEKQVKDLQAKNHELKGRVNTFKAEDRATCESFRAMCDKECDYIAVDIDKMYSK
jgi:hypothetical protein